MVDPFGISLQKKLHNKVKNRLKPFRHAVLQFNHILRWGDERDAQVILGMITVAYLAIWVTGATLITTIALMLFLLLVSSCMVEYACNKREDEVIWTDEMEEEYGYICLEICALRFTFDDMWKVMVSYYEANRFRFKIFIGCLLLLVAWIGSAVNNLSICYFLTVGVFMYPGLSQHGYIRQIKDRITQDILTVCNYLKSYTTRQQMNLKQD